MHIIIYIIYFIQSLLKFRSLTNDTSDTFELENLQFKSEAEVSYMKNIQYLYIYEIQNSGITE